MKTKLWLLLIFLVLEVACRQKSTPVPTVIPSPFASFTPTDTKPPVTATRLEPTPTDTPQATVTPLPPKPITVGAYYYPWYDSDGRHWQGYLGTPILGNYSVKDAGILQQHTQWAVQHGISFFVMSWRGEGGFEDTVLREHWVQENHNNQLSFAILYESIGLLTITNGQINLDDPINRQKLSRDFQYLAQTYFNRDDYLRVNGEPVLFFYLSRDFTGDISGAIQLVEQTAGETLYIVGDEVYWHEPQLARLQPYSAVTAYNMHRSEPDIAHNFAENVSAQYELWAEMSRSAGVGFVPGILPAFDDTAVRPEAHHPIIPRDIELFTKQLQLSAPLAQQSPNMMMITSWNEWHEYTSIEPAEEYDFSFLSALDAFLQEVNPK